MMVNISVSQNTQIDFGLSLPKFFSAKGTFLKDAFFDFFKPKIGRKVHPLEALIKELWQLRKITNSDVVQTNYAHLVKKTKYTASTLRACFAILEKFNIAKRDIKTNIFNGVKYGNVLFIETKISPEELELITKKEKRK